MSGYNSTSSFKGKEKVKAIKFVTLPTKKQALPGVYEVRNSHVK